MDINRIIVVGRFTKDPELKYTDSGTPVTSFSIANNRSFGSGDKKREIVSFFNCVAWSKLAGVIEQYCVKGQRVGVEGFLQQRSWDDKDGKKRYAVEIVVDNVQFLSEKQNADRDEVVDEGEGIQGSRLPLGTGSGGLRQMDEEIPF